MHSPFHLLDCTTRMFISSLCLTSSDLRSLRLLPKEPGCCVSAETTGRAAAHRLLAEDDGLAGEVATLLDLRHIDTVDHVRASCPRDVADHARTAARTASGPELEGWAWAMVRDARADVRLLGGRLMAETYVRGMRSLAEEAVCHLPADGSPRT